MNELLVYKKIQLFINVGILFGVWANLFYQTKDLKSGIKYNSDIK